MRNVLDQALDRYADYPPGCRAIDVNGDENYRHGYRTMDTNHDGIDSQNNADDLASHLAGREHTPG